MSQPNSKRTVLITGAAGRVGSFYRKHVGDRYQLRLTDSRPIPDAPDAIVADIADLDAMQEACKGVDTVLHLGANPHTTADFYNDLLEPNFKGVYNIFRAAKDQGCRRVVFASTINAVAGYGPGRQIRSADAPCPLNVYGASKAFGESLGAYFASQEGLSVISIRIGMVATPEQIVGHELMDVFVSERDLCKLIDCCIETPGISHFVAQGASRNRINRMDITDTCKTLGYAPLDDAFAITDAARGAQS